MSAPVNLSSTVRAVTIYRRGAMVTRAAELVRDGDAYPSRVQLVGLPLALEDSSVRVEIHAESDAGSAPVAGDLRVTLAVPELDAELAPPSNDELEQAKLDLALAAAARDAVVRAKARLAKLQPGPRGKPEEGKAPAPSPTAARLELLAFRSERTQQLAKNLAEANERLRQAKEHLETLRERERIATSARNARTHELRKAAILELDVPAGALAKHVRVELHYFVPGARWAPAYTIKLDRDMRSASLELRALVGQATGEDWHGVALTLSTALPQQWTELPELKSRRIGRRQPPPAKTGWRPPPVGAEALYADYDRGLGQPEEPEEPELEEEVDDDLFARDEPSPTRAGGLTGSNFFSELQASGGMPPPPPSMPPAGMPPQAQAMPAPEMRKRSRAARPDGAPMPPPAPAPMPVASAPPMPAQYMPRTASKSAGIGAALGGAIEGLASAFGSAEASMMLDYAGGGPGGAGLADTPAELLAGRDLLDYGRLRMFPASSPRRGSLRRIDVRMQYEQLAVTAIRVDVAVSQIKEALEWADLLETERAPERHHWPSSRGGFDYAYVAEAPVDLASVSGFGTFSSLPIDLREAEATARYVSVPRETQDVFRIVSLRNPLAAPLLPGPADVYVDGKFALTSDVALTPIDGRIELGLGVEQAIKIARNVSFSEDSSGMFKRHLVLHHRLALDVQNHLGNEATVEIRERLPVAAAAQEDDISIEVESAEPHWDDYEPKDPDHPLEGGRVWTVKVPAAGKRELSAHWVIKIPANHELIGGNRRES